MIPRYSNPEMARIWADEQKYEYWRRVEVAVCEAWSELGVVPADALPAIQAATFDLKRIDEIFQETRHDVIAFVRSMAESAGPAGRYIHFGLTSNDVWDTATSLQLAAATDILLDDVDKLEAAVSKVAVEHRLTPCIGRSHGIHAEPTTFGHKLTVWVAMLRRNRERVVAARREIAVGQISGAVGTHANVPARVEEIVCERLGIAVEPSSTQILLRDRHAAYVTALATVAATLEMMATELRHLQRTEVFEAAEPFSAGQQGSSSMPHKRNPELTERICGLARIVRAAAIPALENVALWHERDISHSSAERIIFPDATIALDYMLQLFTRIMNGLDVFPDRMMANLKMTRGLVFSERVLLALVQGGMVRNEAYLIVQEAAKRVWAGENDLRSILGTDTRITDRLTDAQLDDCFELEHHMKGIDVPFARLGLLTTDVPAPVGLMYRHPFLDGGAAPPALGEIGLTDAPLLASGKVREIYDLDDRLLIVATDRLSAFDVVMREPIPGKGIVLSTLSAFWFKRLADIVPNHFLTDDPAAFPGNLSAQRERLAGRAMLVRRCQRLDVECVVRGYLAGSGWAEYRRQGTLAGEALPSGLLEASKLPEPRFTPTTKATEGHDQPMTRAELAETLGGELATLLEEKSIALYTAAHDYALERGIIVADTKFEFGLLDGELVLIDEALTPDSSRFWPVDEYRPGKSPPSLDKQPVRDHLEQTGWDKRPPPPPLADAVVRETSERYREAFRRLVGPGPRSPDPPTPSP